MVRLPSLVTILTAAQIAVAPALVVTTAADEDDRPRGGEVSLREAIRETAPGETITFDPSLSGATLTLTRGQLFARRDLTIDASSLAEPFIVSANQDSRVLEVTTLASVALRHLTIRDGFFPSSNDASRGAGILNAGNLELQDCTFLENSTRADGGAVFSGAGQVTINSCAFRSNGGRKGGALFVSGATVSIEGTAFETNSSQASRFSPGGGGALHLESSTLILGNSRFSGNTSSARGGALFQLNCSLTMTGGLLQDNEAYEGGAIYSSDSVTTVTGATLAHNKCDLDGGGLHQSGSNLRLTNCTFAANTNGDDGGGLYLKGAGAIVRHCTFSGNRCADRGGGIYHGDGPLALDNSILAGNDGSSGDDYLLAIGATLTPVGANLIGAGVTDGFSQVLPASPLVGTPQTPVPAHLSPVLPVRDTLVIYPLAGSPALSAAVPGQGAPPVDQLGVARPLGEGSELGSIEVDPDAPHFLPPDQSSGHSLEGVALGWTFRSDADRYRYYVGTDPANLSLLGTNEGGLVPLLFLKFATTYYWQIEAEDGAGTERSAIRSFTTKPRLSVTSASDITDPSDGVLTLREAFEAAAASPGVDVIRFDPSLAGQEIELSGAGLTASPALTVDASALNDPPIVSHTEPATILHVPTGAKVHVSGLSFRNGSPAIVNDGILTLHKVAALHGLGAVSNSGELTAVECDFCWNHSNGNGSAVSNSGDLILILSNLNHNTAEDAGALYNSGNTELIRCTLAHNRAANAGGAIYTTGPLTASFCTIAENLAGRNGGGLYSRSDLNLRHLTITRNQAGTGGGLYLDQGSLDLGHSLVAANSARQPEHADIFKTRNADLVTDGANLIGVNGDLSADFPPGPLVGTTENPLDPLLAPLGLFGGTTPTSPPLTGSPAIDGGQPSIPDLDQRLAPLPQGSAPDLGSVEFGPVDDQLLPFPDQSDLRIDLGALRWRFANPSQSYDVWFGPDPAALSLLETTAVGIAALPLLQADTAYHWRIDRIDGGQRDTGNVYTFRTRPEFVVTTQQDELDETDGELSLREAILRTNAVGGPNRISFDAALNGATIDLAHGALPIRSSLTIDASQLGAGLTISAGQQSRVIEIDFRQEVILENLTITEGFTDVDSLRQGDGGGIHNPWFGSLTLVDCTLSNNSALGEGGGLYDQGMALNLTNCVFSNNECRGGLSAIGGGGGVFSTARTATISGCLFEENLARYNGGGANLTVSEQLILENSTFRNNTAHGNGGGAYERSNSTVTNCTFEGNTRSGYWVNFATAMSDCRFLDNLGTGLVAGGTFLGTNLAVEGNSTSGVVSTSQTTLQHCHILRNSATDGGGLSVTRNATCTVLDCLIENNSATEEGGGAYNRGSLTLERTTIADNNATAGGGVFALSEGPTLIINCTLARNWARRCGGGFNQDGLNLEGSMELRHCTVIGNSADAGGGGYLEDGDLILRNSIIAENIASQGADLDINPNTISNSPRFFPEGGLLGSNDQVERDFPPGPLTGTPDAPLAPALAPFGDNGGPAPTAPPGPGSPAIDAAASDLNTPTLDQRGGARLAGPNPDLGAVEFDLSTDGQFPRNAATGSPVDLSLRWTPPPNLPPLAVAEVFLGPAPDALAPLGNTSNTSFDLPPLEFATTYFWRVDYDPLPGAVQSFTTKGPLVVNRPDDHLETTDGLMTLRRAVQIANGNPGRDLITFHADLSGAEFQMSTRQMVLTSEVVIDATSLNEKPVLLSGGTSFIRISEDVSVTIMGLALERGGGISNLGHLSLSEMVFRENGAGNEAGAIYSASGTTLIERCHFEKHALTAIVNGSGSTMEIRDTNFIENGSSNRLGGGIKNFGGLTVERCAFVRNSARHGSGIYQVTGRLILRNSTFAENEADTSATIRLNDVADALIDHCTIVGNRHNSFAGVVSSGIVVQNSVLTLTNSIVAGSQSRFGDLAVFPQGSTITQHHNLIGNNSGVEDHFPAGPLTGTLDAPLDPRLAPVGDHGGLTLTRPPLADSPAIDAGSGALAVDQRGGSRLDSPPPDLGALEAGDEIFLTASLTTLTEGDAGSTPVTFTVTRTILSPTPVTLEVTVSGPAASEVTAPPLVVLPAGQSSVTFSVDVPGDEVVELDEAFTVMVANPSPAVPLFSSVVTVLVRNDDYALLSVESRSMPEGDLPLNPFSLTIRLDNAVDVPIRVWRHINSRFDNDIERQPSDWIQLEGRANETLEVFVNVIGDDLVGPNTYFEVELSTIEAEGRSVSLNFPVRTGIGTIVDDDFAPVAEPDHYLLTAGALNAVDVAHSILRSDRDEDSPADSLHVVSFTPPLAGSFTLNSEGAFEYLPPPGFIGLQSFSYRISDGLNQSEAGTITLEVVNPGPPLLRSVERLPDRSLQLQWHSTPGHRYTVLYSSDLRGFTVAASGIVASAPRSEWIDSGPPATATVPAAETARFYKVVDEGPAP